MKGIGKRFPANFQGMRRAPGDGGNEGMVEGDVRMSSASLGCMARKFGGLGDVTNKERAFQTMEAITDTRGPLGCKLGAITHVINSTGGAGGRGSSNSRNPQPYSPYHTRAPAANRCQVCKPCHLCQIVPEQHRVLPLCGPTCVMASMPVVPCAGAIPYNFELLLQVHSFIILKLLHNFKL